MLTRADVTAGLAAEYAGLCDLLSTVTVAEWHTATRCTGWQVRDVAGHVTGNATDAADGTIGDRTPEEQARAFRRSTQAEVVAELGAAAASLSVLLAGIDDSWWEAPSRVPGRSIGNGVLTLWYDAYVHADDIRTALGRPAERGPGLVAAVHHLHGELQRLERGPLRLALDGIGSLTIGEGGPLVTGDPLRFVLVASGRSDPAELGLDQDIDVYSVR